VIEGSRGKEEALRRYHAFSESHRWKFEAMKRVQDLVPRIPPRALTRFLGALERKRFTDWAFNHYLGIAPPEFATAAPAVARPLVAAA